MEIKKLSLIENLSEDGKETPEMNSVIGGHGNGHSYKYSYSFHGYGFHGYGFHGYFPHPYFVKGKEVIKAEHPGVAKSSPINIPGFP